jgi:hypothetical protein
MSELTTLTYEFGHFSLIANRDSYTQSEYRRFTLRKLLFSAKKTILIKLLCPLDLPTANPAGKRRAKRFSGVARNRTSRWTSQRDSFYGAHRLLAISEECPKFFAFYDSQRPTVIEMNFGTMSKLKLC